MFSIQPTEEEKTYAWDLVRRGMYGRRGHFDGPQIQQYAGILGETVMADVFDLPRPGTHADNGYDFVIRGKRVDVKTILLMRPPRPEWANNVYRWQYERHAVDVYVFCSTVRSEAGRVYVHGCIAKSAITEANLHPKGTERPRGPRMSPLILPVDTYEIPTRDLLQAGTPGELADKISMC